MTNLNEVWTQALCELTEQSTSAVGRTWLEGATPVGWSDDTVILATRDSFAREQLDLRYGTALRDALSRAAGRAVSVVLTVAAGEKGGAPEDRDARDLGELDALAGEASARHTGPAPVDDGDAMLNPNYVFDRFVIGSSNRFAHAAAFAVAEAPARAYNPLFVYGDAGLGKTHLLQAIGHYARHLSPSLKVRYVTTEQFTNEFIDGIQNNRRQPFQRRYRDVDILLIDDIQFIQTRERTQEEFFHTFNALHTAEKQIVVTCDRPPKAIGLEERLRTRFEWGLITDVQPPDVETRIAILRKRAEQEGRSVPDEVLEMIASRISTNIRELEGAYIRVSAYASLQRTDVTSTLATIVLKDLFPDEGQSAISISLIMSETATYMDVTLDALCSKSRTRDLVRARQIAMYVTRELTELSLPKIGDAFGGRDHTTVLHAQRKIAALMGERAGIYEQVQELTSRIKQAARRAR